MFKPQVAVCSQYEHVFHIPCLECLDVSIDPNTGRRYFPKGCLSKPQVPVASANDDVICIQCLEATGNSGAYRPSGIVVGVAAAAGWRIASRVILSRIQKGAVSCNCTQLCTREGVDSGGN